MPARSSSRVFSSSSNGADADGSDAACRSGDSAARSERDGSSDAPATAVAAMNPRRLSDEEVGGSAMDLEGREKEGKHGGADARWATGRLTGMQFARNAWDGFAGDHAASAA